MALNWIDVRKFSFQSLLLLEEFQIRLLTDYALANPVIKEQMGMALWGNPAVAWYLKARCPSRSQELEIVMQHAKKPRTAEELREAEVAVMDAVEDFIIYTRPELMDAHCDFLRGWEKSRLFELAEFSGMRVLDVGAGNGRLTFAAAERAKEVFAVEPVATLREYMREKARRDGIRNVFVTDGLVTALPYPDDTFDIVMSGHVVGDEPEAELKELTRVVKSGGWLLDCPGENQRKMPPSTLLRSRGWEEFYYASKNGGDVWRYRLRVKK